MFVRFFAHVSRIVFLWEMCERDDITMITKDAEILVTFGDTGVFVTGFAVGFVVEFEVECEVEFEVEFKIEVEFEVELFIESVINKFINFDRF